MDVPEVLASQPKSSATVSRPIIYAKGNESQTISCESRGQPLSACVWEVKTHGRPETIVIYNQDTENGNQTSVDGVLYAGDGLQTGQCGLEIESVFDNDFGLWSCTLLAKSGTILTGLVTVEMEVAEPSIYFVTGAGNFKAISLENFQVKPVTTDGTGGVFGIAYDSIRHMLYWSGLRHIYRAYRDGSGVETVFDTSRYGTIYGLDFDWIAGNIFMASADGYVLTCDAKLALGSSLRCAVLVQGLSNLYRIAIDPLEGTLYLSKHSRHWLWGPQGEASIVVAQIDGSNPVTLVRGLKTPYGVAIDFLAKRIYWADEGTDRIESCDPRGQDLRTIVQLPRSSKPWGIALLHGTIYWGSQGIKALQSSSKNGSSTQNLYSRDYIQMMTIVPPPGRLTNRTNHCKGQHCSGICVLTTNSFRCLN